MLSVGPVHFTIGFWELKRWDRGRWASSSVRMAAGLTGCTTVLVSTGWTISHLVSSLVPRLPLFFVIQFVYYMEAEEQQKQGRSGNTNHMNDVRWTQGGYAGEGSTF